MTGKIELSLRLSHIDPSKAKKIKRKQRKRSVAEDSCEKQEEEESDSDDSIAVVCSDDEERMRLVGSVNEIVTLCSVKRRKRTGWRWMKMKNQS